MIAHSVERIKISRVEIVVVALCLAVLIVQTISYHRALEAAVDPTIFEKPLAELLESNLTIPEPVFPWWAITLSIFLLYMGRPVALLMRRLRTNKVLEVLFLCFYCTTVLMIAVVAFGVSSYLRSDLTVYQDIFMLALRCLPFGILTCVVILSVLVGFEIRRLLRRKNKGLV